MVAFLASGMTYSNNYSRTLKSFLSIQAFSYQPFLDMIAGIQPHVQAMLDSMCDAAKTEMKEMVSGEIGSWKRAVTTADGCWLTRGYHSRNTTFTICNYMTGAVLYVTIYAKRDHMPYFVKNELYTVPDSPVDADFNEVFCTGISVPLQSYSVKRL